MRDPEGIARAIREARTIAICSHISPDGDTIGSALAMRLAALSLGKTVRVFCQDKVPDNLLFLPGVEEARKSTAWTGRPPQPPPCCGIRSAPWACP